jgi:hypothetical protein
VSCLLVGTGGRASDDGLDQMAQLVRRRFAVAPVALVAGRASRSEVLRELAGAAARCRPGGLFLLLFSGHGGFDGHQHRWKLDGSELTDDDLAEAIGQFERDSEIVIVSDCCYGAGILSMRPVGGQLNKRAATRDEAGRRGSAERELLRALEARLRSFTDQAAARLRREPAGLDKARGSPPRGNVVLVAATDWLMVRAGVDNAFVRALCAAVPQASSYAELLPLMHQHARRGGQASWSIAAAPPEVMARPPLSP